MIVRVVPASSGLAWIREGLRLLGRRPLSLLASVGMGFVTIWLLGMLPVAGPLLAAVADPVTALGMIAACRAAEAGRLPTIEQYIEGLRQPATRRRLVRLGLLNAALLLPILALIAFTGLGEAIRIVSGSGPQNTLKVDPQMMAIFMTLSVPLLMAKWLAPPLAGWNGLPAGKAMFFSFFACWRNRWPLLTFLGGIVGLASLVSLLLGGLAGLAGADDSIAALILAPMFLGLLALLQCGTFRMYSQIVQDTPPQASSTDA